MKTFDQTVAVTSGSAAAERTSRPSRYGQQLARRHADLLRVSAARQQRAHLVADGPAAHPRPDRRDAAGALQARVGGGAGRRVVEALPLEQVGAVDGAGHDLDQDLSRSGRGVGDLRPHQGLGSAGYGNGDRMHAARLLPRLPGGLGCALAPVLRRAGPDDRDQAVRRLQGPASGSS
ncbi:hypothetical protein GCM10020000_41060 [Streptomyces olivoverticillatus]